MHNDGNIISICNDHSVPDFPLFAQLARALVFSSCAEIRSPWFYFTNGVMERVPILIKDSVLRCNP